RQNRVALGGGAVFDQPFFPAKRMADDGVEVVESRLPAEHLADPVGLGDDGGWIAVPALGQPYREIALRRALHRADHVEHREAAAIAAIQHLAFAAGAEIAQRVEMRTDEIAYMDVVADTGAIFRRIVGAEHFEIRPLPERGFARDFDEMRRARRRLPASPKRI